VATNGEAARKIDKRTCSVTALERREKSKTHKGRERRRKWNETHEKKRLSGRGQGEKNLVKNMPVPEPAARQREAMKCRKD